MSGAVHTQQPTARLPWQGYVDTRSTTPACALRYRQLGYTTVDEDLALVEQAYPGRPVPAKVQFLLTEIVDSLQD